MKIRLLLLYAFTATCTIISAADEKKEFAQKFIALHFSHFCENNRLSDVDKKELSEKDFEKRYQFVESFFQFSYERSYKLFDALQENNTKDVAQQVTISDEEYRVNILKSFGVPNFLARVASFLCYQKPSDVELEKKAQSYFEVKQELDTHTCVLSEDEFKRLYSENAADFLFKMKSDYSLGVEENKDQGL